MIEIGILNKLNAPTKEERIEKNKTLREAELEYASLRKAVEQQAQESERLLAEKEEITFL